MSWAKAAYVAGSVGLVYYARAVAWWRQASKKIVGAADIAMLTIRGNSLAQTQLDHVCCTLHTDAFLTLRKTYHSSNLIPMRNNVLNVFGICICSFTITIQP